ncbi:hypothetical protein LELG_01887 [Lodderomyces elongisporus NRRL YB-4239]|uniref:Uncharacterized protein n=1 Tax=Lodderomyces elongisporus (strain ATCC 11503 / CBS 2605 / JCM 1781 / NBRC 1676 / NRRL YB-4239) TaxID=379508 RepID=A5DX00_LODEL|nr:hypothetical protein LELG_01887 [Lodderomyces elongisporus NRRL YB-4239]
MQHSFINTMSNNENLDNHATSPITNKENPCPSNHNNFDQLNISRTVILKNLAENTSLHQILDNIDYGPIEHIKLFTKQKPNLLSKDGLENNDVKTKICHISFINNKISMLYYTHTTNASNLDTLRETLHSHNLKIQLNNINDSKNTPSRSKQDLMKPKTINYINNLNATRCISLKIGIDTKLPLQREAKNVENTLLEEIKQSILVQCEKFGDVENFDIEMVNNNNK